MKSILAGYAIALLLAGASAHSQTPPSKESRLDETELLKYKSTFCLASVAVDTTLEVFVLTHTADIDKVFTLTTKNLSVKSDGDISYTYPVKAFNRAFKPDIVFLVGEGTGRSVWRYCRKTDKLSTLMRTSQGRILQVHYLRKRPKSLPKLHSVFRV
ncbi:hypothetical protein [Runella slithyformis]|uniref:Uncharacterized protein n=1 Tax=Runella slithyformis (strain ATCC 29530 / DSM 19594 / LMG 11500 / NCIMB 11436 / LSU 4) TaxID=761193 RepID=A0A7U4E418_RUNSL|nr:hypothetical protein [Runella slithyformis]AEI46809.1 hypothetical protein Runsl_0357 [Runella slithyformis DSM 19594]